jgi:pSer/pThr/pTyr-binding forkhead associated (FHA) protein
MGILITVMSGVDDGRIFETDKSEIMLGRHFEDDVCLPYDNRVSRHHARISKDGLSSYCIEDMGPEAKGSTNGTYIDGNDKKISGKTSLSNGQIILLGNVWVKFEVK